MKILLFGKGGQVGWELQRSLAPLGDLVALDARSSEFCGDLSDLDGIAQTVRAVRPDLIVNAAAYTAVDKAESEPERAHLINADAPGVLAREAQRLGGRMVHYSTDYVFDGSGTRPWTEADEPAPLSVYGASKLAGERHVSSQCANHLIFRTSWIYAARGGNFAKTMLRLAQERDRLTVIDDQFGAPTGAELLADVTAHSIRAAQRDPALSGLYHLTAAGETNWNMYARFVLTKAQEIKPQLALKALAVEPVPTSGYPTPAARPLNSRLDCARLESAFDLRLPPWQNGVERMLHEML
ncbi:MAG: dTDP-4-dehydrorhamnose reductase [Burkholderiales bacterium]